MKGKTLGKYTQLALIVAIIFVINIIANFFHAEFDLTEDKRFTLSDNTKQLVSEVDDGREEFKQKEYNIYLENIPKDILWNFYMDMKDTIF